MSEAAVTRVVHGRLTLRTGGPAFHDLTPALRAWLGDIGAGSGAVCAFVAHTTASLCVQENADDDVQRDLLTSLARLAPENAPYRHHFEGPDDMPGHIKAMLSDTSVMLPVEGGAPRLGTWQALYLVEHRTGARERAVHLTYPGD
ncbi:secondary thiamine-phosphate synthase enzyme YjbQ [Acuticoccus kandeliae]|uniref:secondary thiamine-phosphate synthase enzyme YjbQ n=1 Tax=Acuticoccus kandeliae TaxID=2073160 RepID=UPI001FE84B34|nr:secondary thiamine-phosphate synthase enzyme YjbQ [Acuticoccus kandeliae]